MDNYARILYPIQRGGAALPYAVQLAKKHQAELLILYTYRLTEVNENFYRPAKGSIKNTYDEQLKGDLEAKYGDLLKSSGIAYQYLFDIGFLTDRIFRNIESQNIDLLLLESLNHPGDEQLIEKFSQLSVPVMLIPHQVSELVSTSEKNQNGKLKKV